MLLLRRTLLKGSASSLLLLPLMGTGLLRASRVLASDWQTLAFGARSIQDALKVHGSASATETRDIQINAPEIAENGAKVEIEVSSNLPNTRSLAIFVDRNPLPLAGTLEFLPPALPYARVQLRLAESSRIRAVARTADGKWHVAFREIKVTLGGCGG